MVFGIEKCKTLSTAKGELEMTNFTTEDDDTMEAMNKDEIYRYMGHMQSKQIKHAQMKQKLGEEYIHRTKSILNTKLNGKNTIKAMNTYATPSTNFKLRNSEMDVYRLREPPNKNECVTHKI